MDNKCLLKMGEKTILAISDTPTDLTKVLVGLKINQIVCSQKSYERYKKILDLYKVPIIIL